MCVRCAEGDGGSAARAWGLGCGATPLPVLEGFCHWILRKNEERVDFLPPNLKILYGQATSPPHKQGGAAREWLVCLW